MHIVMNIHDIYYIHLQQIFPPCVMLDMEKCTHNPQYKKNTNTVLDCKKDILKP